jgi:DNA-directed RNA polymerase specialized sigma24 family protein
MTITPPEPRSKEGRFAQTHWSVVMRAGHGTEEERREAVERLCRTYWKPLYYFLRGIGRSREEAEDVVQEFFVQLLDGRLLASADPSKGKFRTLILTALRNVEASMLRSERAQKRGGGITLVPLDVAQAEEGWQAREHLSPAAEYDRAWATALLDRAGARVRFEYEEEGKAALFEELFPRITGGKAADRLADAGLRLGMSEIAVRTAASRMRRRYADAMRAEVAATVGVGDAADCQDEMRYLLDCFS